MKKRVKLHCIWRLEKRLWLVSLQYPFHSSKLLGQAREQAKRHTKRSNFTLPLFQQCFVGRKSLGALCSLTGALQGGQSEVLEAVLLGIGDRLPNGRLAGIRFLL